ncbi:type VII secretion protein EssC [Clostridium felsineum]|uniref:type VII secretion protein EssC n=1 Tax=Clostridium felsineum TaxID=36839 RepID=UPI00098BEFC1|nr:type VII secretion protein EssC [Clostridium felsineum]
MEEKRNYSNVLILYNSDFYKEIDLDDYGKGTILVGNGGNCDIKLKLDTEELVYIYFNKINTSWQIKDGENAYCIVNDIKTPRKVLINGDQITIKNLKDREELFKINFFIDFIVEKENYDKVISLKDTTSLSIGKNEDNNICVQDDLIDNRHCEIKLDSNNEFYVTDLKSKYGVYVDGKKVEDKVYLKDNNFITICGHKILFKNNSLALSNLNENIIIKGLTVYNNGRFDKHMSYPDFYRSPRFLVELPQGEIEIDAPPDKANKVSMQYLLSVIPVIGTVVMMSAMSSKLGGNSSYMMYSVGMVGLSAIVSVVTFASEFISSRKYKKKRNKFYREYISEKEKEIASTVEVQKKNLKIMNPEIKECFDFVGEFDRRLWERKIDHPDFLNIMLGHGDTSISFSIKIPDNKNKMEIDELEKLAPELRKKYQRVKDVPLSLNLLNSTPIGVVGRKDYTYKFISNLLVKITASHFYKDVKVAVIAPNMDKEFLKWVRWVPHIWSDKKDIRFMGFDKESSHNVLSYLYEVARERADLNTDSREVKPSLPHYIVFVADNKVTDNEPIMPYLENKNDISMTAIFVNESIEMLPSECTNVIKVLEGYTGNCTATINREHQLQFAFDDVNLEKCYEYSKRMAPINVRSSFSESSLKSMITLFDLYGIKRTKDFNVLSNWEKNKVYETMEVPIGVKAGDEIEYLNLHEKYHGPHGLVAGTTGSGKSEILQTYIISLAINYHPYDVALIIIDYKGGGMANLFKNLPHLVGTITNLDGNQINRSLVSIKSELKRRQRIFGRYNVNHIDAYIKLYKEKKVTEPIPHLLIVADEFAELKSDQPEFMAELVSTARIGRSLGVHLILATQKPAGVVDNQIWSNSKFKLCLKVQDAEDSKEVLKSSLAADIVEPGRAYFQVGNNEIFELFQSAWSGAKKYDEDDVNKKEIEIFNVGIDGTRSLLYSTKDKEKDKKKMTQLDAAIEEIDKVCSENNIERLDGPWLPPLEAEIYLEDLLRDNKTGFNGKEWIESSKWICPVIGMLDDPERQDQRPLEIDLGELGHLLLIGAPGYGKTTFLQTLMISLMLNYTPEEVNMYILDFGARTLKMYEESAYVGGVVTSDDEEKLMNLLKYIRKEIDRRKKIFSQNGVGSLKAYREVGGAVIPQIVMVLDNYAALIEFYPDLEDEFIFLSREGGTLGISLVITAASYSNVRYKVTTNFKLAVSLTCVDKSEYSNITGRVRMEPENKKGRILINTDSVYEAQIALPSYGESEAERALNTKKIINKFNSLWTGKKAKPIPIVPEVLNIETSLEDLKNIDEPKKYTYPIGIDYDEVEHLYGNLIDNPILTVVGKSKTGKSNVLKSIAHILDVTIPLDESELYLIDSGNYGLLDMKEAISVKAYCYRTDETRNAMLQIKNKIEERRNVINELKVNSAASALSEKEYLDSIPLITVFIDDINDFIQQFNQEIEVLNVLGDIIEKDKNLKVSVVAAGTEESFMNYMYTYGFVKEMRNESFGFMFDSLNSQKFHEIMLPYNFKEKNFTKGDSYFIRKDEFVKIKVPLYSK